MQRTLRLFPSADLVSLPKSANRILRSPLAEATHVAQIYRRAVWPFDGDAIRWQFFEEKKTAPTRRERISIGRKTIPRRN